MKEILFEYLRRQSKIIIYGAGDNGKFLKNIFEQNQIKVLYFCDSNELLWDKNIEGIECIQVEKLVNHTDAVLIISPLKYAEIETYLQGYKFKKKLTWGNLKFLKEEIAGDADETRKYLFNLLCENKKLKEKLDHNRRFKDIHKGKRCFILGNGPSLLQEDLTFLSNEITFTVNQIARNPQFEAIHTNYHFWADPHFFKLKPECEGDYALLELMKKLPGDAEAFFLFNNAIEFIEKFELYKYININYYATNSLVGMNCDVDFSSYIPSSWTVVQYAVKLAFYMGFKEIYLLGCDCTAIINTINARLSTYNFQAHCYDADDMEKERERNMYLKVPLRSYYQVEIGILDGYDSIKQYAVKRNIHIYNCTQGGLLEVFPRKSLSEILAGR